MAHRNNWGLLGDFNPMNPRDLDQVPEEVRQMMAAEGLQDTYYLATVILGYDLIRPETHGPLCVFLDTCDCTRRLIQMPRSHFKTTIVTITKRMQDALRDTSKRILLVGNSAPNVRKHLAKIRTQLENNNLLRWCYRDRIWEDPRAQSPLWSQEALVLPNKAAHGEPTFDTIGVGGSVASRHYDIINPDDIISDEAAFSKVEMDKTCEWATGMESLFVPPISRGQLDIPSTFWRTDDVYAFLEKHFGMGQEPVKTGPYSYQRGVMAVFRREAREDGKPIFPEAITNEWLDRLRETNPERYAAQYALNPRASDVAYFKPQYLHYYEWRRPHEILITKTGDQEIELVRVENLMRVGLCDPHAGGSSGKFGAGGRAAVLMVGVDEKRGRLYMLDCWIKRAPTDQIITEIIRQNELWYPDLFSIEANGLQKMLKFWLDERVDRERRMGVPYEPYYPEGEKNSERRIKGLQPLFRAGQVWLQRGFTEFIEEYTSWPRGTMDGLDAMAQILEYANVGWDSTEEQMMQEYELRLRSLRSVATGY